MPLFHLIHYISINIGTAEFPAEFQNFNRKLQYLDVRFFFQNTFYVFNRKNTPLIENVPCTLDLIKSEYEHTILCSC